MFEPQSESIVLEIVRGFLDIPSDEMMRIGDMTKDMLFGPEATSEQIAVQRLKTALNGLSKEQAVIAGMFISGLLRCNMAQQAQKFMQEMGECGCECECECGHETEEDQGKDSD